MEAFDNTQSRLLEAAGQVFSEKGYRDATVREICLRAGARNVAAVNYYFRDKEHLYRAVIRAAFRGRYQLIVSEPWPEGLDAAQKLYLFVRNFIQHVVHDGAGAWQSQLLMRELAHPSECGGELVRQYLRPVYELLWSTLRELVPPDVSETKLHLIAFSIIGQCLYHRLGAAVIAEVVGAEEQHSYDADCLAEHITQFSLTALGLDASHVR